MVAPCTYPRLGITLLTPLDQLLLEGDSSDYSDVVFTNFEHGFFTRIVYEKISILNI